MARSDLNDMDMFISTTDDNMRSSSTQSLWHTMGRGLIVPDSLSALRSALKECALYDDILASHERLCTGENLNVLPISKKFPADGLAVCKLQGMSEISQTSSDVSLEGPSAGVQSLELSRGSGAFRSAVHDQVQLQQQNAPMSTDGGALASFQGSIESRLSAPDTHDPLTSGESSTSGIVTGAKPLGIVGFGVGRGNRKLFSQPVPDLLQYDDHMHKQQQTSMRKNVKIFGVPDDQQGQFSDASSYSTLHHDDNTSQGLDTSREINNEVVSQQLRMNVNYGSNEDTSGHRDSENVSSADSKSYVTSKAGMLKHNTSGNISAEPPNKNDNTATASTSSGELHSDSDRDSSSSAIMTAIRQRTSTHDVNGDDSDEVTSGNEDDSDEDGGSHNVSCHTTSTDEKNSPSLSPTYSIDLAYQNYDLQYKAGDELVKVIIERIANTVSTSTVERYIENLGEVFNSNFMFMPEDTYSAHFTVTHKVSEEIVLRLNDSLDWAADRPIKCYVPQSVD